MQRLLKSFVGGLLLMLFAAPLQAADDAPSFLNEIVPILTRQGCNQGGCHGKGAGQNGFRLSLRGYAPESDYQWITREFVGRRIDPSVPENSLMLRKPTGAAAHEGGRIFDPSGREYKTLLDWIRAGTPGPKKDDAKLLKLDLKPQSVQLKLGEEVQLTAIGEFSDGSKRDVTWLTKFDANDAGLAAVSPEGLVKALRNGETAIRASFQTEVAAAMITVPYANDVAPERFLPRNNFVDDAVFNKLKNLRIEPSDLCADEEFVRRVFLDAIGTLPEPQEVRDFLADKDPAKRSNLIDALLARPEFVDYWTLQLSDLLQNRKERDHDVRGLKGVRSFHLWIRTQVEANRHWDDLARDVLTATGNVNDNPAVGYYIVTVGEYREVERSEVIGSVAQAFLGTRIGCAQCHNHPLERFTQDDYYHFAGFFSKIKFDRFEVKKNNVTTLNVALDANGGRAGVGQPRTGQFMKAQPLDRSEVSIGPKDDPRVKLAAWITDPGNRSFSGAMVNRIWKHYLGVGMVEPVDDLRATNPPSNLELWQALDRDFVEHHFDLKHVMRTILNSRTYQLNSATVPANAADARFYSHYYARRLPAEVLFDAIGQCTGIRENFSGYPKGMRAIQLPDPGKQSYFLTLFGRSERTTACACERNGEVTMPQLLHLQNDGSIANRIVTGEGRMTKLLASQKDDNLVMDELFLAAFSRLPSDRERQTVRQLLATGGDRLEVFRDLFWALLNSKNFAFNH
jgi:hypothetical protein